VSTSVSTFSVSPIVKGAMATTFTPSTTPSLSATDFRRAWCFAHSTDAFTSRRLLITLEQAAERLPPPLLARGPTSEA
jgi:hypothetical protein